MSGNISRGLIIGNSCAVFGDCQRAGRHRNITRRGVEVCPQLLLERDCVVVLVESSERDTGRAFLACDDLVACVDGEGVFLEIRWQARNREWRFAGDCAFVLVAGAVSLVALRR